MSYPPQGSPGLSELLVPRLNLWFPNPWMYYAGTETIAIAANTQYAWPFPIGRPVILTGLGCFVAAAGSGSARLYIALYAWTGPTNTYPAARKAVSAELDASSTGAKSTTGLNVTLDRALYWVSVVANEAISLRGGGQGYIPCMAGMVNPGDGINTGYGDTVTYGEPADPYPAEQGGATVAPLRIDLQIGSAYP